LQICHRGQALNLAPPSRRCEDLTGTFVPAAAPVGWAAVVRPDRRVMIEGPVEESPAMLREALAMLGARAQARLGTSKVLVEIAS
jgi:3-(3-hydroxy-phenyl)propionate hydroxylase